MKLPIVITPGDAAGIGPEVALKAAQEFGVEKVFFAGPRWLWQQAAEHFSVPEPDHIMPVPALRSVRSQRVRYGQVSATWGRVALECVRAAAQACLAGDAAAIVTAPLTKAGIHAAGYHYQGHTDFLADITRAPRHAMMLSTGRLRVMLVTIHQALRSVAECLTAERIRTTIELAHLACTQLGIAQPRIAVCGLNPHASENGAFGSEERVIITPAIRATAHLNASGPYPADSVFLRAHRGEFDIVVAMYHDQGLIPIKLLGFERGVNTTIGLPIVRTSPDHGSAYDIAGRGIANYRSTLAALRMAARLARHRPAA